MKSCKLKCICPQIKLCVQYIIMYVYEMNSMTLTEVCFLLVTDRCRRDDLGGMRSILSCMFYKASIA